jgi:hypothetical protein
MGHIQTSGQSLRTHQSRYISLLVVLDPGTLTHKAEPGGSVTSGQGGTRRRYK